MIIGWQRRSNMLALGVAKLRGSAPPCPLGVVPAGQVVCWARSARQKPRFTGEGCRGVARSVQIARSCITTSHRGQLVVLGVPEPAVSPRQRQWQRVLIKIGLCPAAIGAVLGLGSPGFGRGCEGVRRGDLVSYPSALLIFCSRAHSGFLSPDHCFPRYHSIPLKH